METPLSSGGTRDLEGTESSPPWYRVAVEMRRIELLCQTVPHAAFDPDDTLHPLLGTEPGLTHTSLHTQTLP